MIENLHHAKRFVSSPAITANHTLLTAFWTADVAAFEAAIGRFTKGAPSNIDCRITFFEVAGDQRLHVNVIHKSLTKEVSGWAGPGDTTDGFVHNRTFARAPRYRVLREIREMVFAASA